jgi:hypothetical protein
VAERGVSRTERLGAAAPDCEEHYWNAENNFKAVRRRVFPQGVAAAVRVSASAHQTVPPVVRHYWSDLM